MFTPRGARLGLTVALLLASLLRAAFAAEVKLSDVTAEEDSKHVRLRFTFSEPVKPDLTYFYTHNYVGLRATGLKFSVAQLKRDVPPPSDDAARAYRYVRFVQDKESAEIRIYLTKPLTPADAQIVPYDTYIDLTLIKPAGPSKPMTPLNGTTNPPAEQPAADPAPLVNPSPSETVTKPEPIEPSTEDADGPVPTLRTDSHEVFAPVEPPVPAPEAEPESQTSPTQPGTPEPEPAPAPAESSEPEPAPATTKPVGGPSYTDFDLDKVPVTQLVFKGKPFREALTELVSSTGYNVIVADDVDNSEVSLNFKQKEMSLKAALDLLSVAFDLEWSLQPDAIVIKAKPQQ